eukprot:gene20344-22347_t
MAANVSKTNGTSVEATSNDLEQYMKDVKMEYGIKYERLLDMHQEMQKAYIDSQKNAETNKNAYKDFVNQLKQDVFDKELEIYHLKQEVEKLKIKNDACESPMKSETRKSFVTSMVEDKKPDLSFMKATRKSVLETPIVQSTVPKLDVSSPLCLPETPRCVSRTKRHSIMNETIERASRQSHADRDDFLKSVIIEQKELLDFYATMTGYMAWKETLPKDLNNEECLIDCFKMKPQDTDYKDMEIQFLVDYEQDDIEYHPVGFPENQNGEDNLAACLREKLYLSTEVAPQLFKALIDVLKN